MGIKSLGNALSSFNYIFGRTGTEASRAAGGAGLSASGGNQATATGFTNGGYKYHVFTSSGALTVTDGSGEIQFLVVAGGGGGGYGNGGAGGAGGLRTNDPAVPAPMKITSTVTLNPGPYTITVGSGGPSSPAPYPDRIGSNSSIGSLVVASGGGAGGPMPAPNQPYMDGGSGGGSEPHAGSAIVSTDPLSPNKQGNDGGTAGGGGGGGGAGGSASGAAGGAKHACPAFSSPIIHPGCPMPAAWQTYVGATGTYAGGGYGYPDRDNSFNAPNISPNSGLDNYAGIVNTGGGADSVSDSNVYGGKGIVIIRYPE